MVHTFKNSTPTNIFEFNRKHKLVPNISTIAKNGINLDLKFIYFKNYTKLKRICIVI